MIDRRDRIRFLVEEREAAPWRERLAQALAGLPAVPALRTPPEADAHTDRILGAWERARERGPVRTRFGAVEEAAAHLAARASGSVGGCWVLPGPKPRVGVLEFDSPPDVALIETLITWNGQGCTVFLPGLDEILLVDMLDDVDGLPVEIQCG